MDTRDPLMPVILNPKCDLTDEHKHFNFFTQNLDVDDSEYKNVLFFCLKKRSSGANIHYFNCANFFMKDMQLKVELTHAV
jgi:hypothetical protein